MNNPTGKMTAILVALVLVLVMTVPVLAESTAPTVIISDYTVTPSMLMPGDTGTLAITLSNTAQAASVKENTGITQSGAFSTTRSTDINIFIENVHLEGNGITVTSADFDRLGELGPGQSMPVTFLIEAPSRDGIYFPEVWVDIKGGTSTRYPIPVNVNTHIAVAKKPDLSLEKIPPEHVIPGEDFPTLLTLVNRGAGRADDISVVINATSTALSLKSPANYYISHLESGEKQQLVLLFSTDRKIAVGIRDIPVSIEFRNPDGTRSRQTEHIGIPIKGKAEIAIAAITTDPVRIGDGDKFTMTVRIENTGTADARSVQASIDLPASGNRDAFIGRIEPDNDAPAVFYLQDRGSGEIHYTLKVQYADDYGNHTAEKPLMLSVAPPNYTGSILTLVILLCLACGAYWYWRTKRN
ncbi:COG1361 S-layer family protein [Methanoregula sp.]|uniref:COG1361 S-layer family protein n=1 Tax=Methanoregula sp. TaxID=2052170 RepID=UPI0035643A47